MELQDRIVNPPAGTAELEITDATSVECCGNDLVGKARFEIPGQTAERVIALILREDALAHAASLPPMSDCESLFSVWENNASQAVTKLNKNARSDNEMWSINRFAKAILTNFGYKWPQRNRQESGYIEFCRKEKVAIPDSKTVIERKRNLMCTVQGCENLTLRQNNGKFCGACIDIEINRKSKRSAILVSSDSLPVDISATASTRQQESNGQFYCVVQKLLEIHALQHLICNIFFHTQVKKFEPLIELLAS